MPLHPAWVKNIARCVLCAALEADITKDERRTMADFFSDKYAYCDTPLPPKWHADHLSRLCCGQVSNRVREGTDDGRIQWTANIDSGVKGSL